MAVLKIRKAKLSDVPALARIERDSFVSPWSAEEIARDVSFNERAYVAAAVIDGEPVGYADMWLVAGEAQLYNIVVDNLEVRHSNVPAISLYLKSGFRQVGERKGYYRDNGEDAVLMDRDLSEEDEDSGDGNDLEVDIEVK